MPSFSTPRRLSSLLAAVLLGLCGFCAGWVNAGGDLRDAGPDTLRYRVWHIPARLARHARERVLKISPDWP